MTAHSADRAATGAGRFTQQARDSGPAPRRSRVGAVFSALALLALVAGVPVGLYVLAAPLLADGRLSEELTLTGTLGIAQVLAVLVVVAALAWLQFVICVLVELGAALRGGVLAAPVPLSGPSQRLARWLVGSMLLAGVMAGQMGVAQAATRPDLGAARSDTVVSSQQATYTDPDTFYVFDANTAPPKAVEAEPVSHVSNRQLTARQAAAEAANARRNAAQADRGSPVSASQLSRDELALDGHKVYVVEAPTGRHHDTLWEIAERHLGDGRRYHEIYRLNEGRLQPDGRTLHLARLIQPGWRLILPEDAVGVTRWVADRTPPRERAADPTPQQDEKPRGEEESRGSGNSNGGAAGPATSTNRPSATRTATTAPSSTAPSSTAPTSTAPSSTAPTSTAPSNTGSAPSVSPSATSPTGRIASAGDPNFLPPQHPGVATQGQGVLPSDPTPPRGTSTARPSTNTTTTPPTSTAPPTNTATGAAPGGAGAATTTRAPSATGPNSSTGAPSSSSSSSTTKAAPPTAMETTAPTPPVATPSQSLSTADGSDLPAELIGAGLVTAALLGTLLLIRRRRRGGQDQPGEFERDTEVWLRTGADADRGALLDLALRSLPRACREAALPLPQAYGAVVDDEGLDLLLTMAHASAPPPWAALDDGLRWRLTYDDAQHLVAHGDSAYPLLASVGRDHLGRDALINLGAAAGPVAVIGSPGMAAAVVRALALGLAGNPWSRGIEVLTADLPPALPAIAAGRLIPVAGAKALTEQLEQGSTRMPRTGPVQILTGGPAPGSRPERVAIYGAPLNVQTASRLQTVVARGADLAVLVTGELPGARWRLQVDDSGVLTCDELSLQVTANRLGDGSIERLHTLFVSAGTPDLPVATGPEGERVVSADLPEGVVETDDITWSQSTVRVAVLGEVEVHAPGRIDPRRLVVAEEILAYLALHPAGTHPTVLGSAIWPRGVTADVRDDMLAEVREWLGPDESGQPRLREGSDGRLRLTSDVPCDWDVLRTLIDRADRAGQAGDQTRERDLLIRALHLVRGPLVGGIAHGTYTWLPRTGVERQAEHLILDAAGRLCRITSEEGDHLAVEQAATAGLRAVPHAQNLWRHIIRAEYALGGPGRLHDVADHVRFVLASSGVDIEPETATLIEHLAGSAQTQSGAY
nr:BTAD domain-containing putative transcriptional regulator [Kineosporia rhizophila]